MHVSFFLTSGGREFCSFPIVWVMGVELANRRKLPVLRNIAIVLLCIPGGALAVDGVKEINQTCAQIGCFPGDSPGYPIEITENGSYVLTSTLDVSGTSNAADRTGISVTALRVSIDLNGFGIVGPTACTGFPVTACAPVGSGDGIRTPATRSAHIQIHHGFIRGMGRVGLNCGSNCTVSNLRLFSNGTSGVNDPNGESFYRDVASQGNGGDGFFVAGVLQGVTATGNADDGIFTNPGSRIVDSRSENNGGRGVRCSSCLLTDSVIRLNDGVGVDFGFEATFGGNLIAGNAGGEVDVVPIQTAPNRCGASLC